jgi:MFS family permease
MASSNKRPAIFYGWWVVAAGSLIGLLSSSSRFSFTMFFPYLLQDLGWTRATLGFGLTLHMWVYGVAAIACGFLTDRYGPRILMVFGGCVILIGLALTSRMTTPLQFYLYYGVILAFGVSCTMVVPNSSTARKWFVKKGGLAVALTVVGTTLGISLMSLIVPDLIHAFGWRKSWLMLGLVMGTAIMGLSWFIVRKDPESMGLYPDGEKPSETTTGQPVASEHLQMVQAVDWTVKEAFRTRSYWCLLAGNAFFIVPVMGFMGHVAAWGMDIAKISSVPEPEAIGMIKGSVFLLGISSVLGSLAGGPLSDKIGKKSLLFAGLTLEIGLNFFAIRIDSLTQMIMFCVLAGAVGGTVVPLWAPYLGDIFGRASLASLFGIMIFAVGIIGGAGPVIFGEIFDASGSYRWAFLFAGICYLASMASIYFIRKESKGD